MGSQAAAIGIVIRAIEKCINLSFARSTAGSRYGVLRDPLRDRNPLDRALMTILEKIKVCFVGYNRNKICIFLLR